MILKEHHVISTNKNTLILTVLITTAISGMIYGEEQQKGLLVGLVV